MFDAFDASSDLVALSVNPPLAPAPASNVQLPAGVTQFSLRSHESALAFKPPLAKKDSSKFDAPKLDPLALPSVGMEYRLLQVCQRTAACHTSEPDCSSRFSSACDLASAVSRAGLGRGEVGLYKEPESCSAGSENGALWANYFPYRVFDTSLILRTVDVRDIRADR